MSSVELRSEPAGQSDGNDFPCRPNERDSAKSRNRIVPILITVVTVALAALLAWAMWKAYMSAPWTRDGQVCAARAWMKRRVEAGQPALSGMFTRAEVTYAWPRTDGTVGSDREPVALFTGEAVHAYLGHLSDETIEAMLNELSIELGAALGQERIYVAFADRTWILDAGERCKTSA